MARLNLIGRPAQESGHHAYRCVEFHCYLTLMSILQLQSWLSRLDCQFMVSMISALYEVDFVVTRLEAMLILAGLWESNASAKPRLSQIPSEIHSPKLRKVW